MQNWTIKNHGLVVNLYQIKKMLNGETIEATKEMLEESYVTDLKYIPSYNKDRFNKNMTFAEYVNAKRHWLASILGKIEYA